MDEKSLAQLCSEREPQAMEELYRKYSSRILVLCIRYCPDIQSAEDTMHNAFITIFERIKKYNYEGEGSLYRWMARISINLCFDSFKKRKQIKQLLANYQEVEYISEDPFEDQRENIPSSILKSMVASLPEGYRTVFLMHAVDGLSHKEIAKILGIKEHSSSSNYSRAKAILAQNIKEYYNEQR